MILIFNSSAEAGLGSYRYPLRYLDTRRNKKKLDVGTHYLQTLEGKARDEIVRPKGLGSLAGRGKEVYINSIAQNLICLPVGYILGNIPESRNTA